VQQKSWLLEVPVSGNEAIARMQEQISEGAADLSPPVGSFRGTQLIRVIETRFARIFSRTIFWRVHKTFGTYATALRWLMLDSSDWNKQKSSASSAH
jgi:hypothetical protein